MAGPSAIGSENGIPNSTTSAPAGASADSIANEVAGSGSPAVRNVTSPARPCALSSSKRRSIRVIMLDPLRTAQLHLRSRHAFAGAADLHRRGGVGEAPEPYPAVGRRTPLACSMRTLTGADPNAQQG